MRLVTSRPVLKTTGLTIVLASAACHESKPVSTPDAGPPPADAGAVLDASVPRPTQTPLSSSAIPQFVDPLPVLSVANGTINTVLGNRPITVHMCEFWAHVLPTGTFAPGEQPRTRVWGYIAGDACPPNGPGAPANDTYIGPVIVSERNHPLSHPRPPTTVTWVNDLGTTETTQLLAYTRATDQTLHWADPLGSGANTCAHAGGVPAYGAPCARNYVGPIPATVHLHGGEVPPQLDGGPESWFLSQPADGYAMHGRGYYSFGGRDDGNRAVYAYPNTQEAAPLWFHDHTLGATRLNVYAGLAGGYILTDPEQVLPQGLTATGLLAPKGATLPMIPVVLQTRTFDTNGQLLYPANDGASPNPQHPYWAPEFFGTANVVNGKVWPFLAVEPRRYRFLLLDGADSEAFVLSLQDTSGAPGPALWVIGTEEGLLDDPVRIDQTLRITPGERYEVIVDFSGVAPGTALLLANSAERPFPNGMPVDPATNGRVLQFRVGACTSGACGPADPSYDPARRVPLRTGSDRTVRFSNPATGALTASGHVARVRQLTLNEVGAAPSIATDPATGVPNTQYRGGPLQMLLNNTLWSGQSTRPYQDFTPVSLGGASVGHTELPQEGDAELWEIVNLTMDAHPIHTHLSDMQIVNRQPLDAMTYTRAYDAAFPAATVGGVSYPGGQYIPGFGPPLDYANGNPRALGGNPDVGPYLLGPVQPPAAYESGWKDTIVVPPGYVTRVIVRLAPSDLPLNTPVAEQAYPFDPSGGNGYVWHCHILSHEDNEMMRPFTMRLNPAAPPPTARPLHLGQAY